MPHPAGVVANTPLLLCEVASNNRPSASGAGTSSFTIENTSGTVAITGVSLASPQAGDYVEIFDGDGTGSALIHVEIGAAGQIWVPFPHPVIMKGCVQKITTLAANTVYSNIVFKRVG
jgi:hypothetical protein